MSEHSITLLLPADCSKRQLKEFHDLVISGNQVQAEGLPERIASAALLAFAHVDGQLAGVASIKNQKRSYITGIFLKAKVPRLAEHYDYEIGYAVTHEDFRQRGICRDLLSQLIYSKPTAKFYATTKNDDMRSLLEKTGFKKIGQSYQNLNAETLDVYTL